MAQVEGVSEPISAEKLLTIDDKRPSLSASLLNELLSFTTGTSFALFESASEQQNGIEAWRLLSKRFNLAAPQECVQLMSSIVTMKISHNNEILSSLLQWEAMVGSLARDHKEILSERIKVALMVRILPQAPQERVHEQLDRLTSYKEVSGPVVSQVRQ